MAASKFVVKSKYFLNYYAFNPHTVKFKVHHLEVFLLRNLTVYVTKPSVKVKVLKIAGQKFIKNLSSTLVM